MKKLLLIAAATVLSTNVYAAGCGAPACGTTAPACGTDRISPVSCATSCADESTEWYGTASVGAEWFRRVRHTNTVTSASDIGTQLGLSADLPYTLRLNPKPPGFLAQLGMGYRPHPNMRAEFVFLTAFPRFKARNTPCVDSGIDIRASQKTRIYALMVKALFDLPICEQLGVYGGPGIGAAWVQHKTTVRYNALPTVFKSKRTTSPIFGVFLGANVPIDLGNNIGVFAEVNYLYIGKTKLKLKKDFLGRSKHSYKGFGLTTGIRYGF